MILGSATRLENLSGAGVVTGTRRRLHDGAGFHDYVHPPLKRTDDVQFVHPVAVEQEEVRMGAFLYHAGLSGLWVQDAGQSQQCDYLGGCPAQFFNVAEPLDACIIRRSLPASDRPIR